MTPRSRYGIAAAVVLAAAAAGLLASFPFTGSVQPVQIETSGEDVPGPLDGMTFAGVIGTASAPERTKDTFVFSNGTFISIECVKECGYHAGAYFVREKEGKTEFFSVSRCGHKDAKIEWRGTVQNGVVSGESTWTVNRWYRTVEKKLLFQGRLVSTGKLDSES